MTEQIYDVTVVGAGVEGSATAYQLSKQKVRVLLLEKFPLPHSRGSSHGQTRITRKAYPEDFYTEMMTSCCQEWEEIQRLSGHIIYKKIGYLAIGPIWGQFLNNNISSLESNNAPYQLLAPENFKVKYPNLRYGDDFGAIFDPEGGTLMADRALRAYQTLFVRQGGQICDGEPVVKIEPGEIINITTTSGRYKTRSMVLCCGPWTNQILKPLHLSLPLQPIRISVCYWPEKIPGTYGPDTLPTFFEENVMGGHAIYGLPSEEYPGHVKLCLHDGPNIDPERRDSVDSQWTVSMAADYVRRHLPGLESDPSVVESCIYTMTPDKHFILDRHPMWKNIIIGAGFSGHGFKLSPAVGKILADMALHQPPKYDISHFRIDRFSHTHKVVKSNL